MCNKHYRHSIFCILPPHILDQVVRNGSQDQRDCDVATLNRTHILK
jgi:hypothetical protein